jgi:hypothetical protein
MTGYLQEFAAETGDRSPLEFWLEIRHSITAPLKAWVADVGGDAS